MSPPFAACVCRARVRVSLLGVFVCVWVGFWRVWGLRDCLLKKCEHFMT